MKRSLILKLASAIVLQVSAQCVASPLPIRVIALRPDDVTTIIAERGELAGDLQSAIAVSGFDSPQESVTWSVDAPQENDYAVSLIFSSKYQATIEVCCGESVLTTQSLPRTWAGRAFYWRQELPGLLHVKAGKNRIVFRLPEGKVAKASKPGARGRSKGKPTKPGNLAITADVTREHPIFNEQCMAAMEQVRRAIRGK